MICEALVYINVQRLIYHFLKIIYKNLGKSIVPVHEVDLKGNI